MKICYFSDIHGNGWAFRAFLSDIKEKKIDLCIFGGDVFGYYYDGNEILNCLRRNTEEKAEDFPCSLICLLGNHDKNVLSIVEGERREQEFVKKYGNAYRDIAAQISPENIGFLSRLTSSFHLDVDGSSLLFCHGGPEDPLNMRIYPDAAISLDKPYWKKNDYIFCGHTHHKMMLKFGDCTVVNPGSIGQQRDGKGCSYVIFDTKESTIHFYIVTYDVAVLEKQVMEKETDEILLARLIEVLYRKNVRQ